MIYLLKAFLLYEFFFCLFNFFYRNEIRMNRRLKQERVEKKQKEASPKNERKKEIRLPRFLEKLLIQAGLKEELPNVVRTMIVFYVVTSCYLFFKSDHVLTFVFYEIFILLVPYVALKNHIQKRQRKFLEQLGPSLTMMANSLESGFSFDQSLQNLSEKMSAPIAEEFAKVLHQSSLGLPMEKALLDCAERMESEELLLLEAAYSIQKRVGGNLSEIVENIAETIQSRQELQNKIKTLSAQGKISGIVIGLLPIFILLIFSVVNPSYVSVLFTTRYGLKLLLISAFLELMGLLSIRRIIQMK